MLLNGGGDGDDDDDDDDEVVMGCVFGPTQDEDNSSNSLDTYFSKP